MSKEPFHFFDLHIHTAFSDAQIETEKIVQILISNGIKIVGFTDHLNPVAIYTHPRQSNMNPKGLIYCYSSKLWFYRRQYIDYLNRKYPEIIILNSAEIDILPHGTLSLPRRLVPSFFDYLLVSKHQSLPFPLNIFKKFPNLEKWLWQHDPGLKLNQYLWEKGLYTCFKHYKPQIFAHPQQGLPKYLSTQSIKRCLLYCKKYDVALELNGMQYWRKQTLPHAFLKYGKEYGVKFSLGSDFHGFQKDYKRFLNFSQDMYELTLKYGLKLIDPYQLVPKNLRKKINEI